MKKGFTLIELLVVISIIGSLASLALVSYSGAQKQTRDTQRRSDLAQYRNGIENFAANNNGMYPAYSTRQPIISVSSNFCNLLMPDYISACPVDPIGGTTYRYYYTSDGTTPDESATATQYVLWATLETGGYWEVCSDGRAGKFTDAIDDAEGKCQVP
ncbi:MAG: type II secretion system GspH family protein [Candidatus Marinimicrobia bacterium]|nr:type II secretion system GspH family protein [Candidatus Neomarinimicrobiota bacterium]